MPVFFEFIFTRLLINMTTACVLDLSKLTLVSRTQILVELEKLMTDRYKKILVYKLKASAKTNQRHKKFIYFSAQQ